MMDLWLAHFSNTTSSPVRLERTAVKTHLAYFLEFVGKVAPIPLPTFRLVHNHRAQPQSVLHPSDHQRVGWQLPVVKWRGRYFDSIIFLMSRLELINASVGASAWLTLRNINWTFPSLLTAVIHFKCYLFSSFCPSPEAVFCGTVFFFFFNFQPLLVLIDFLSFLSPIFFLQVFCIILQNLLYFYVCV